jgi:hypothetical protein
MIRSGALPCPVGTLGQCANRLLSTHGAAREPILAEWRCRRGRGGRVKGRWFRKPLRGFPCAHWHGPGCSGATTTTGDALAGSTTRWLCRRPDLSPATWRSAIPRSRLARMGTRCSRQQRPVRRRVRLDRGLHSRLPTERHVSLMVPAITASRNPASGAACSNVPDLALAARKRWHGAESNRWL